MADARLRCLERAVLAGGSEADRVALNREHARRGGRGSHPLLRDPLVEPAPLDEVSCVREMERRCWCGFTARPGCEHCKGTGYFKRKVHVTRRVDALAPSGLVFFTEIGFDLDAKYDGQSRAQLQATADDWRGWCTKWTPSVTKKAGEAVP